MKLYNTLSKQKEDFAPREGKRVTMFVCGPTVYDYLHIGNGRTAITMDVLARLLKQQGYDVRAVMNVTDIDDKIIKRSQEKGIDWRELTKIYEDQYKKDMEGLNVRSFEYVRATEHIDSIITQVQTLIDKGFAYTISDGIYFEISKFADYGKLSGREDYQEDDAQSRIDESKEKRGWNDFCLWKFKKEGEPSWAAPFGEGRPGWHIEDTAITEELFGPQYDIHGGGTDLIFPHHEAELTQMEAASGKVPFVKYWVHGGMLRIDGRRMGKSNQNFLTIHEVASNYTSGAVRLMMLQAHYRSELNFSTELLDEATKRYQRWQNAAALRHQALDKGDEDSAEALVRARTDMLSALQDDLNTPEAFKHIEAAFGAVEDGIPAGSELAFEKLLQHIDDILGLDLLSVADIDQTTKELLDARAAARTTSDWAKADELRQQLAAAGIVVRDTPNGQLWARS